MRRLPPDVLGTSGIAVLVLIYLAEARKLPFGEPSAPDLGFLPISLGWGVLALCLLLTLRGLLAPEVPPTCGGRAVPRAFGRTTLIIACLAAYPLLLTTGGFILATAVTLFVIFRTVRYGGWLASALMTIATTLVAYLVFAVWLHVYFPKGFWG